ncbi:Rpn family recombination-promoting nuclease/putative transposase [Candidatus Cyanaurora vandensis]|uniref:Rpn family recombination-promoting nuclease/putative transposase n=1 Tax=Candidatus Cyanaurora vandensis TaxID=2714958 RepID=UPI00257CADDE|nr:Rpn family recombination-promoting nuclease/putative transposase [Candidatus Cyanaurora vandensis]
MKTDSLFYTFFQTLPSAFFDTLGLPPQTADRYSFDSIEVKQLSFRIDGVFLPQTPDLPIYFVEAQFQSDAAFYSRFFSEIFMYLDKVLLTNDWRDVVLYPRRSIDPAEEPQNIRYRELLQPSRVQRLYLNELGDRGRTLPGVGLLCLAVVQEAEVTEYVRGVLRQAQAQGEGYYDLMLELVGRTLVQRYPEISRKELMSMMELQLTGWKESRVFREVLAEGRAEGELKGKAEGKLEGKLEAVPALVARGFTVAEIAEILGLSVAQVQAVQP